jgi:hypothetical protein
MRSRSSVAIEVGEVRRGPAEDLKVLAGGRDTCWRLILGLIIRALVADEIHIATERAFDPHTLGVVGVVPAVVGPIADTDDDVGLSVAIIVDILPHVRANLVGVHVRWQREFLAELESGLREVRILDRRRQDPRLTIGAPAELDVLQAFADAHTRLEHRHGFLAAVRTSDENT